MTQHIAGFSLTTVSYWLHPLQDDMELHLPVLQSGDVGRGLLNPGNMSVTFVPLIAVMANVVPKFLTRFKNLRPTQTVAGRGFREARLHLKETINLDLCKNLKPSEYLPIPQYSDMFFSCNEKGSLQRCKHKVEGRSKRSNKEEDHLLLGKVSEAGGCYYLKLFKCPRGSVFIERSRSCLKIGPPGKETGIQQNYNLTTDTQPKP